MSLASRMNSTIPSASSIGNIHTLDRYRRSIAVYLEALHSGAEAEVLEASRRRHKIDSVLADLEPLIEGTLEGAVRISEIVKNLRRLSFNSKTPREAVALAKVVQTASQWASRSKKNQVAIETKLEADLFVLGQDGQIHSVIGNLIDNALDAVRDVAEPRVVIETRGEGDMAMVEVTDNGRGVPEAIRGRIFEPFFTTKKWARARGWACGSAIRSFVSMAARSTSTLRRAAARASRCDCRGPGRRISREDRTSCEAISRAAGSGDFHSAPRFFRRARARAATSKRAGVQRVSSP